MTEDEASALVAMLATAFDVPAWQPERLQLFAANIGDLDYEATASAVQAWLRTETRRPMVADIRNAVRQQLEAALRLPGDLEPDEAWGYVMRCFRQVGVYRPFPTEYPLVAQVVERLGWRELCLSENMIADRARFLEIYRAALGRERERRLAATQLHLEGDAERLREITTPVASIAHGNNGR